MRKIALLFVCLVAATPLKAAWWLQNEFVFGSSKTKLNSTTYFVQISTAWSTEASASFYTNSTFSGWIPSGKLSLNRHFPRTLIGIRPLYYPPTTTTPGHAEGGTLYTLFQIPLETEESSMQLGTSLSSIRHHSQGNFNETIFELQMVQSFFREFQFLLSGTGFYYDQSPKKMGRTSSVVNQMDVAMLQTVRPFTEFPEWTGSVQFARATDPESQNYFFLGYSATRAHNVSNLIHSLLTGMDFRLSETWHLNFSYNAWKRSGFSLNHYYAFTLRYAS
ncbi:MAG: hypothetical protein HY399_08410 [Elusimicrobia bacterium]|nr:hypothetical protein [Elusimicrobiota bacterium]